MKLERQEKEMLTAWALGLLFVGLMIQFFPADWVVIHILREPLPIKQTCHNVEENGLDDNQIVPVCTPGYTFNP